VDRFAKGLMGLKPARARGLICLMAALPCFVSPASAQYARPAGSGRSSTPDDGVPFKPFASVDEWRQNTYHQSGTLGRMGLGASPFHPEGPGNVSTPGR